MAINYLASIDLNQNELQNAYLINPQIENQPNNAAAGTGVEGQLYYDTTLDVVKVWANGAWTEVGGGVTTVTTTNGSFINLTPTSPTSGAVTVTADLSAVDGTATSTTRFLDKNNKWSVPVYYTDADVDTHLNTGTATTGQILSWTGSDYDWIDNQVGDITAVEAGTYLNGGGTSGDVIVNHDLTSRTDTASSASPAFGGTFTAVDSVTSNSTGHITAINLKTVTLPTPTPDTDTTYTLPVSAGGANTAVINLTAGGSGSGIASSVTFSGTTNEIEVTETTGNNGTITIGLPNNVTVTGALTVSGAAQSSFGGQVTIPQTPAADTDAASKHYVDQSNIGQSVFQGGYNAATNVPDLDVAPSSTIKKGWFWAVTNTGTFFAEDVQPGDLIYANIDNPGATFANWTVVQSGQDIAGEGASDGATTKGIAGFNSAHFNVTANGWVSSDIYAGGSNLGIVPSGGVGTTFLRGDGTWVVPSGTYVLPVATSTTLGGVELFSNTVQTIAANPVSAIASRSYGVQLNSVGQMVVNVPWVDTDSVTSVSASAVNNRLGLAIDPTTGAVVAGLSIDTLADITTGSDAADSLPIYDLSVTTNKRITLNNLTAKINAATSFTNTGPAAAGTSYTIDAVTHGLGSDSSVIMVQLVIVATGETVYADVTRGAAGLITITFAVSQAINTFRALLQKIG